MPLSSKSVYSFFIRNFQDVFLCINYCVFKIHESNKIGSSLFHVFFNYNFLILSNLNKNFIFRNSFNLNSLFSINCITNIVIAFGIAFCHQFSQVPFFQSVYLEFQSQQGTLQRQMERLVAFLFCLCYN